MNLALCDSILHSLKKAALCAVGLSVLLSGTAKATTIINGGFETGDLTGWSKSGPEWPPSPPPPPPALGLPKGANVYGPGVVAPGGWNFFTSQPSEGSFAYLNQFDRPMGSTSTTLRLKQDILVTADAPVIAFDYRAAWAFGVIATATQDRTFGVDIVSGGVDNRFLVLTAQHGNGGGSCSPSECSAPPGTIGVVLDTGLLSASIDLTPFVGQTVSLVFEWNLPEPMTGPGFFQLDNVRAVPITDTTPPVLALPGNITQDATSPQGAIVTYTVTATDNSGVTPTVSCIPQSGLTFAIGPTTVSCTATDGAGNSSTGSFNVTVNGPVTQLENLIAAVGILSSPFGTTNSLATKLRNALNAINGGDVSGACDLLKAFINEAQAQSGKKLAAVQASQLIASANQIRAVLGCP